MEPSTGAQSLLAEIAEALRRRREGTLSDSAFDNELDQIATRHRVPRSAVETLASDETFSPERPTPEPKRSRATRKLVSVLVGVIVLSAGAAGAAVYLQKSPRRLAPVAQSITPAPTSAASTPSSDSPAVPSDFITIDHIAATPPPGGVGGFQTVIGVWENATQDGTPCINGGDVYLLVDGQHIDGDAANDATQCHDVLNAGERGYVAFTFPNVDLPQGGFSDAQFIVALGGGPPDETFQITDGPNGLQWDQTQ